MVYIEEVENLSEWSSRDGQKRFCEHRRLMLVLEVEGRTNHGMVDNSMTDLRAVRSIYKNVSCRSILASASTEVHKTHGAPSPATWE